MARVCARCGRPKTDEYHDRVRRIAPAPRVVDGRLVVLHRELPDAPPPIVGWVEGHPVHAAEDPQPRMRYTCRVTLVATSPVSGERFRVNHPQNTAEVAVAWVHDDRLEIE